MAEVAGPAVAAVAGVAVAGDGDDVAGRLHHLADAIVVAFGDEEVAAGVHGHAVRVVEFGGGGRPAVAAVAEGAGAGDGGDVAGGLDHFANAVVVGVGDEDVAAAVHGGPEGEVQRGRGGGAAVAVVAGAAGAGDRGDDRGRRQSGFESFKE